MHSWINQTSKTPKPPLLQRWLHFLMYIWLAAPGCISLGFCILFFHNTAKDVRCQAIKAFLGSQLVNQHFFLFIYFYFLFFLLMHYNYLCTGKDSLNRSWSIVDETTEMHQWLFDSDMRDLSADRVTQVKLSCISLPLRLTRWFYFLSKQVSSLCKSPLHNDDNAVIHFLCPRGSSVTWSNQKSCQLDASTGT